MLFQYKISLKSVCARCVNGKTVDRQSTIKLVLVLSPLLTRGVVTASLFLPPLHI